LDVHAHRIRAAFTMALARTAGAVPTIEWDIDLGSVRRVGHELVGVASDHPRHAVFELERNVVRHEEFLLRKMILTTRGASRHPRCDRRPACDGCNRS